MAGAIDGSATHQLMEERDLGPTLPDFVGTCWEKQPTKLILVTASGGICLLLTCVVTLLHRRDLLRQPISLRRMYYLRIAYTPVVMGATAYFAIWSPATTLLSAMLQKFYEAVTLSTFGMLLYLLLWYEGNALVANAEDGNAEMVAKALAEQGPRKHWGAPPLGCCFRPCLPKHDLSVRDLSTIFWLVRQYVLLTPCVGILGLLFLTAFRLDTVYKALKVIKLILLVSNLVCLYGLFVAYLSTHELLHRWNTSKKFISIKVVLIVMVYQEFLLEHIGPGILEHYNNSCFLYVGFHREWQDVEIRFWSMWLLTVEMVFMALALRRAFPAEELQEPIPEVHHAFLDMEMSRKLERDAENGLEDGALESGSEEEDSESVGDD